MERLPATLISTGVSRLFRLLHMRCGSNRLNQNYGLGMQRAHKILVKYF